ncbi:MAG: DNA cytosine methyltransferase [Planctomycetes bacterium]|nr:DNA cytosine methyltransferase [Planctomycetota bacterium]
MGRETRDRPVRRAGRAHNRGVDGYAQEKDHCHRLYEEYLRIVADFWPPVFVMENVRDTG